MRRVVGYIWRIIPVMLIGLLIISAGPGVFVADALELLDFFSGEEDTESVTPVRSGDYTYQINDDRTIMIVEYLGSDADIEIPQEIDGYPVSAVGYQAFTYKKMKSLSVPEGIREIGARAFEYCEITDSLHLPAGVNIMTSAFAYAKLPEMVTIPEGAVLEEEAFAYCEGVTLLIIEPEVLVKERAVDYGKSMKGLVCADSVKLEDRAFEYCHKLEQAVLCGDVEMEGDPFSNCDRMTLVRAEGDEFNQIPAGLLEADNTPDGMTEYSVGRMSFYTPSGVMESSQAGYDLFLIDADFDYILGAAVFPPSVLDFEDDESIRIMAETAKDYVEVDDAYKVEICGYPAVWIDIHDQEDPASVGVYLYISTEKNLYHMMYLNIMGSCDGFYDITETIKID